MPARASSPEITLGASLEQLPDGQVTKAKANPRIRRLIPNRSNFSLTTICYIHSSISMINFDDKKARPLPSRMMRTQLTLRRRCPWYANLYGRTIS